MTDDHGYEPELIYIPDDEGHEEEFEVVMKFELEDSGTKYLMVVPTDSDDETDEVYAFRYEEDEESDELKLYTIEDEEEWNMVEETFNTLLEKEELS